MGAGLLTEDKVMTTSTGVELRKSSVTIASKLLRKKVVDFHTAGTQVSSFEK